jgi:hypothetical protein
LFDVLSWRQKIARTGDARFLGGGQVNVTARQAAEVIRQHLGPKAPTITHAKVGRLVATGVLTDISKTRWIALDYDEVEAFATRTRYMPRPSIPYDRVMRVSVIAMRQDRIIGLNGRPWRDWAGIDHLNSRGLPPREVERAWTGVWPCSDETADSVIGCPLVGSNWGYVHPDLCRIITGWWREPQSRRVAFDTRSDPALQRVIGTGIWVDIPPGSIADLL